jgi:hypothetical protein
MAWLNTSMVDGVVVSIDGVVGWRGRISARLSSDAGMA